MMHFLLHPTTRHSITPAYQSAWQEPDQSTHTKPTA
jgi:hypothetical protein